MRDLWRKRISNALTGKPKSNQHKERISKALIGMHPSKEAREKMSMSHKGMTHLEATKRKMSKIMLGNQNPLGNVHSEKTKRKMSKSAKRNWQNPESKAKRLKAIFASFDLRPTKPERRLRNRLNNLFPNEYKYVGDGSVIIGGKNPDFINVNGQKKLMELFGDYWHSKEVTGVSEKIHLQRRINHFAKYGFKTLIVWECELQNIKQLKRKLEKFHG